MSIFKYAGAPRVTSPGGPSKAYARLKPLALAALCASLLSPAGAQTIPHDASELGVTSFTEKTYQPTDGLYVGGALVQPCASLRQPAGAHVVQPTDVYDSGASYSATTGQWSGGVLNAHLDYYPDVTIANGQQQVPSFCFLYTDPKTGKVSEAPTLHVHPGDQVNISVTNHVAPIYQSATSGNLFGTTDPLNPAVQRDATLPAQRFTQTTINDPLTQCGDPLQFMMDPSSVNVHFHGFLVKPLCGADNVARTIINAGETFNYSFTIPANEPPGLYWFHPHVHGSGEQAVQGGASGTLIVDGIEQFFDKAAGSGKTVLAGLPSRVLVLRDQLVLTDLPPGPQDAGPVVPTWDVSVNYVPVTFQGTVANPNPVRAAYPDPAIPVQGYTDPAIIDMTPGQTELWRVVNASADAILDLQVHFVTNGVDTAQSLNVVGLDGIPIGSQDGTRKAHAVAMKTISMAPGQRTEFVMPAPPKGVSAYVTTVQVPTGLVGDADPARTLAVISTSGGTAASPAPAALPAYQAQTWPQRFENVEAPPVNTTRRLYFFEQLQDPTNAAAATNFFMAVEPTTALPFESYKPWGLLLDPATQQLKSVNGYPKELQLYSPGMGPAITVHQNTAPIEVWTVENRALEAHVFHIHQIHFKLQSVNWTTTAPADIGQLRDDYTIPGWNPPVTDIHDAKGNLLAQNQPYDPFNVTGAGAGTLFAQLKTQAQVNAYLKAYPYPSMKAKFDFRDPSVLGLFVFHCHILAHEDYGMMAAMQVVP